MKGRPEENLKLQIELVPAPLWYRSVAQLNRTGEGRRLWNRIREVELKRARGLCETCGQPARDVHEKWEYDDDRLLQRLRGFEVLCDECHLVHHQGFASVHGLADLALERFIEVNALRKASATRMVRRAFDLWAARSAKGPWAQDFSWLVSNSHAYGFEPEKVEGTLEALLEAEGAYDWSELQGVPTIGPVRAEILEGIGIQSIAQLAATEPTELVGKLSSSNIRDLSFLSLIPMSVRYARALQERSPHVVSHQPPVLEFDKREILFVDLEYDPQEAFIFLIGTMTMDGKVDQDFIEKPGQLPHALTRFCRRVAGSRFRCVSYGSTSADIPMLRRAAANANLDASFMHQLPFLDLFRDVIFTQNARKQWLYLPLKPMDAKSVAHYFGYDPPKNLAIHDGFEALMRYKEYTRTRNPRIRNELRRYNASDLKLTRRIFEELRNLETGRADIQSYRPQEPLSARLSSSAMASADDFY